MLSDKKILDYMKKGEIVIEPFKEENLGSNSYDIRIDNKINIVTGKSDAIDLMQEEQFSYTSKTLPLKLRAYERALFCSKELLGCCKKTFGLLSARSNLSRTGLIFQFSSLLDTGFCGVISGAIINATSNDFIIPKDLRILQIMFGEVNGKLKQLYTDRKWSKNTEQFGISKIIYKPDKEWKGFEDFSNAQTRIKS